MEGLPEERGFPDPQQTSQPRIPELGSQALITSGYENQKIAAE